MPFFMKLFFTALLWFTAAAAGWCQNGTEMLGETRILAKFGQVPARDLQREADHSYPFEYLLNEASIRFEDRGNGIVSIIDRLVRIKVYSDDELEMVEAAMVGIPYYFADGIEQVRNLEGITYHPEGERSVLNPRQTRTVDLNTRYKIIEFEMPGVEQGVVIEYKYTLERKYIEELPDFHFSHRVPTRKARVFLENESFLRFDVVEQNVDFDVEYEEARIDTSSVPLVFTYPRPDPVYIQSWSAENIPAVDASSYISSIDDIRGKMKFQISEFGLPRQPLENSWEFVAAQIQRNVNPYRTLSENPGLRDLGKQIADEFGSLPAAQDSIFDHVNSRVQFNSLNAVFIDQGLDHVLEGEPANQAEINMVLLAMLQGADIDARPLYISGRNFGRINKSFPSLYQFNSMLVHSEIDGKEYFMDASFEHGLPDLIPVESYNEQGMILSEEDYAWADIIPGRSVFELDVFIDAELSGNGDLTGRLEASARGYPAQRIRKNMNSGKTEADIASETFFEVYPEIEMSESRVEIAEDDRNRIDITAEFEIPNYAVSFSSGLEFRPMVVGYLLGNPFESTSRRVPVTLDAPELLSTRYRIKLPDGYDTDVSGETRSTNLAGAELFEEYLADRNVLEYSFDIDISQKEFPADVYTQLRRIYGRWVFLSNDTWFIQNQNS